MPGADSFRRELSVAVPQLRREQSARHARCARRSKHEDIMVRICRKPIRRLGRSIRYRRPLRRSRAVRPCNSKVHLFPDNTRAFFPKNPAAEIYTPAKAQKNGARNGANVAAIKLNAQTNARLFPNDEISRFQ